ncbi:hypothetical protein T11_406 [Trichinella zimbabwensis]|uniref:Uncharacterized protein n=1 Tax=Trichinella zimbabwensis TaxID=268475 RepID=A0A0V1HUU6_9BILA|nr:hypothetical protein T11_406 [Trichinella zimbabwensis]
MLSLELIICNSSEPGLLCRSFGCSTTALLTIFQDKHKLLTQCSCVGMENYQSSANLFLKYKYCKEY